MTTTTFRCYYDDGTITTAEICEPFNQNGAPLIKSELQIIEDVLETISFPWFLIILGLVSLFTKDRE